VVGEAEIDTVTAGTQITAPKAVLDEVTADTVTANTHRHKAQGRV